FVDMQRQEGMLLASVFGVSKRDPEELLEARLQKIIQWQATASDNGIAPPVGSCAAMIFLGSIDKINGSDQTGSFVAALTQRPPIREAVQAEGNHETIRKLLAGWALHCPNNSDVALQRRLEVVASFGLEQALPLPLGIVSGEGAYARVRSPMKAN